MHIVLTVLIPDSLRLHNVHEVETRTKCTSTPSTYPLPPTSKSAFPFSLALSEARQRSQLIHCLSVFRIVGYNAFAVIVRDVCCSRAFSSQLLGYSDNNIPHTDRVKIKSNFKCTVHEKSRIAIVFRHFALQLPLLVSHHRCIRDRKVRTVRRFTIFFSFDPPA